MVLRLCNARRTSAASLVRSLAESGECINQIVTALPDKTGMVHFGLGLPLLRVAWSVTGG